MNIMLTYNDIQKINFGKINTVEEFKKALKLTNEQFDTLIKDGYDSTDTDTPKDLRDYRIVVYTTDGERVPFDLTYNLNDGSLNNVKIYI